MIYFEFVQQNTKSGDLLKSEPLEPLIAKKQTKIEIHKQSRLIYAIKSINLRKMMFHYILLLMTYFFCLARALYFL